MYPLIEITTVPIEIQMKVTDAHLEYARGTAQMEISREQGGLNIRAIPSGSILTPLRLAAPLLPPRPS